MRLLILGGTAEARTLAKMLHGTAGLDVISSLAGRVRRPVSIAGEVRVGGFAGEGGLATWVRAHAVDAIVDATHPFAARITATAAAASEETGVPLLVLRRPSWAASCTPKWRWVGSLAEAASALPALGRRVFLTTGRTDLAPFAGLTQTWFLVRSIEPPDGPGPPSMEVVLDRGPFMVADEISLMKRHGIDVLVTKDSGGHLAAAKLTAARVLDIPVVMQRRPDLPANVSTTATIADARAWVDAFL